MPRMALLDDRKEKRDSVLRGLAPLLAKDNWECIECPLTQELTGYAGWLVDNEVSVLLVDQLLNEESQGDALHVDYKGHEVVAEVRTKIPNFPIVIVTKATEDADLADHRGEADHVIERDVLLRDHSEHVPRLKRLGQKYLEAHADELAELTKLSSRLANGEGSKEDSERLAALQQKMSLVNSKELGLDSKLDSLEAQLHNMRELRKKAEEMLGDKKKE